ncbi:MAG: DUF3299 domain-containing protein [Pseudobdellovibrionaceae bacterium]
MDFHKSAPEKGKKSCKRIHLCHIQLMLSWKNAFLIGVAVLISFVAAYWVLHKSSSLSFSGHEVEMDWRLLGELDFVTGRASDNLKSLDGKDVRIPGFMVPLEDSSQKVTEFLLVPTPQACIHVPAPPPNQMVHVFMKDRAQEVAYGPIWVSGTLKITTVKSMYGESSYQMQGYSIEPYK